MVVLEDKLYKPANLEASCLRFKNKVAVITGSSRGLGKHIALAFAREGASVVVNYLKRKDLTKRVVDLINSSGGVAVSYGTDVRNAKEVNEMTKKIMEKFGKIDILVNNAGVHEDARVVNMTEDAWKNVLSVNLTGVFNCTKAVIPVMMKQKYGRIINMSSVVGGQIGIIGTANYATSKAGVIGFTRSVAREVAKYGITVNTVAPGYVNTGMGKRLPSEFKKKSLSQIPIGRFAEPKEVVEAVLFLASDSASYITGQVINIDGGFSA